MKKIGAIVLITCICVSFVTTSDRFFDIAKNLDIYASVFKELNTYYVDEVNPKTAIKTSIDALLKSFDPYTVFYPEEELDEFLTMTTGKYQGIGIILTEVKKIHYISFIEENSPALAAGLGIGDQIVGVNGTNFQVDKPETDPSVLMKGAAGSSMTLLIRKVGQEALLPVTLERATVQLKNVSYAGIIRPGLAYIKLDDFNTTAAKEVKSALLQLKKQGMSRLIIDLRNNPGGLLTQAVDICNLFLPKGSKIVETRGKVAEWNQTYTALNTPVDTETPIIVLINHYSASAAEIVAGVLQDYDRAVLVGQRSYGKGLVQVTRDLPYRTKMKITTAKYFIPSGRCIQALDYQHRNADGSAQVRNDSTVTTFYTKNKRKVTDGGGIQPDYLSQKQGQSVFTQTLAKNELFFLYAREYHARKPTIGEANGFRMHENDFNDFENWLGKQSFAYENPMESQLKKMLETSKQEEAYAAWQHGLTTLIAENKTSIRNELAANKAEIIPLLEQEIVLHYYLQKGVHAWSFTQDKTIQQGIMLFEKPSVFAATLRGKSTL